MKTCSKKFFILATQRILYYTNQVFLILNFKTGRKKFLMKIFLGCIHIIVSLVMICRVLLQQRKQGGFGGVFGGGTQAADSGQWQRFTPLTKITIALAAVFMVTSFLIVYIQ